MAIPKRALEVGDLVTPDQLEYIAHRFGIEADYYDWDEPSPGWWRERERTGLSPLFAINAIRWAYRNQIKRWEKGEQTAVSEQSAQRGETPQRLGRLDRPRPSEARPPWAI
jgi:hypothetical protein